MGFISSMTADERKASVRDGLSRLVMAEGLWRELRDGGNLAECPLCPCSRSFPSQVYMRRHMAGHVNETRSFLGLPRFDYAGR